MNIRKIIKEEINDFDWVHGIGTNDDKLLDIITSIMRDKTSNIGITISDMSTINMEYFSTKLQKYLFELGYEWPDGEILVPLEIIYKKGFMLWIDKFNKKLKHSYLDHGIPPEEPGRYSIYKIH